jgi:hypothetical protein
MGGTPLEVEFAVACRRYAAFRATGGTGGVAAIKGQAMRGKLVSTMFVSWMFVMCGAVPGLAHPPDGSEPQLATPAVAVQRVSVFSTGMSEEAAMLLVGTALIGLAAAVRRAA